MSDVDARRFMLELWYYAENEEARGPFSSVSACLVAALV